MKNSALVGIDITASMLDQDTTLTLSGPDAKSFLQSQVTCDLDTLPEDTSQFGACCNLKGRVVVFFECFHHQDTVTLVLPSDTRPILRKTLKRYQLHAKVSYTKAAESQRQIGLCSTDPTALIAFGAPGMVSYLNSQVTVIVASCGTRVRLIGPEPALREAIGSILGQMPLFDDCAWHRAEVAARIPRIDATGSGQYLPASLDLITLGAVSLNKGCYLGQEIIARMHYRAKQTKHLAHLFIETTTDLNPHGDVLDEANKPVGKVVALARTDDGYQVLAIMPREGASTQVLSYAGNVTTHTKGDFV